MVRHAIDRWADTAVFRIALMFAALGVAPVLLIGLALTVGGGVKLFTYGWPGEVEPGAVAVVLLSVGGVCGFAGYIRAHAVSSEPSRHNLTATLLLLTVGSLAATTVGGSVLVAVSTAGLDFRSAGHLYALATMFAVANLVWATAGVAWIQRLLRRYRETTGRAFDGLPVVMLFVAIALATAALIRTAML